MAAHLAVVELSGIRTAHQLSGRGCPLLRPRGTLGATISIQLLPEQTGIAGYFAQWNRVAVLHVGQLVNRIGWLFVMRGRRNRSAGR